MTTIDTRRPRRAFIVAEVSRNYTNASQHSEHGELSPLDEGPPISALFEDIIETNRQRGYDLHEWRLGSNSMLVGMFGIQNETIVAIFKRRGATP